MITISRIDAHDVMDAMFANTLQFGMKTAGFGSVKTA